MIPNLLAEPRIMSTRIIERSLPRGGLVLLAQYLAADRVTPSIERARALARAMAAIASAAKVSEARLLELAREPATHDYVTASIGDEEAATLAGFCVEALSAAKGDGTALLTGLQSILLVRLLDELTN